MEGYSVEAVLKATDDNFGTTMRTASQQLKEFGDKSANIGTVVGSGMAKIGGTLTKAVTLPIVGMGVAAVKVGSDFESAMSRVKAISGSTGDSFEALKQQAIDLGAKTAFSAKESAQGMENLASAGFDANEIMSAMPGLLDLAAVSGGDVGVASENAAAALRGFGLEADRAGYVADVFARAAADTNAEVADMGEAMKYVAPVAKGMGIGMEETAAAIGIMSDAGIKGSQAGTTLRTSLARLAKPTKEMSDTMSQLGIEFFDAQGNMKPLEEQIGMLQKATSGMTKEQKTSTLTTLYGQEALSGMMSLVDAGPDKFGKLTNSLKDSDGAASEMAKTMQDNLSSSVEQMFGSFESIAIVIQEILAPAIKSIVEGITALAEKFVSADKDTQKFIMAIVGILAVLGPVLLIVGKTIIFIANLKGSLMILKGAFSGLGITLGAISVPMLLIIGVIVAVVAALIYLWKTNEGFRDAVTGIWNAIVDVFKTSVEAVQNAWNGTKEWFSNLWEGMKEAPSKAANYIKQVWSDTKQFFIGLWDGLKESFSQAWDNIVSIFSPYVESIINIFQPIIEFFSTLWENIKNITSAAWEIIKAVIMAPLLFIINLITGDFTQMKEDMQMIWNSISESVGIIWESIKNILVGYVTAIYETAMNIWNAFQEGITTIWTTIKDFAINTWESLKQGTIDLFNNTVQGAKDLWSDFKQWISDTATSIKDNAIQAWENLKQWTIDTFNAMVQGAKDIWEDLKQSVSDTVDTVTGIFDKIAEIDLWEAGKAIMDSLLKGLKEKWEGVKEFVGGIGDWIRDHKGPIEYDRKLLIPAGNAIMDSLNSGLIDGFKAVKSTITDTTKYFSDLSFDKDMNVTSNLDTFNDQLAKTNGMSLSSNNELTLKESNKPMYFNFNIGGQNFKGFVNNISEAIYGDTVLELQN